MRQGGARCSRMGQGPGTCSGLGARRVGCRASHASYLSGHPLALARSRSEARQPGWGLAGLPCTAETWPVPGALAGGVMRVDRVELITTQPLPEPGSGTRMQEGGRAVQAITGAGRQSSNGRFQAEGLEPLAQVAERV